MSNSDQPPSVRKRAPVPIDACALAAAISEIGERWSLLILREAFYGVVRYDDLREDLGIPRSILTDRLKKLVAAGLLEKEPYREAGERQRFAYCLTGKGRGLGLSFVALTQWGDTHVLDGPGPVEIIDKATGARLQAALVDEDGNVVTIDQAIPKVRPDYLVKD